MSNPIKTVGSGTVTKKPKDPNESNSLAKQNSIASISTASNSSGNVKVVCRVRPINKKEADMGGAVCVDFVDEQTISLKTSQYTEVGAGNHKFVFDRVFSMNASQQEIYEFAAKPVVNSVLEGFNGTVFAYGQTSSGKTHTMQGPSIDDAKMRGIIPRMVNTVFDHIGETPEHIEFTVKVSIVEIYLEKIRDLLSPEKSNLKVREDKARGIYLEDVTESYVSDEAEVYDIMKLGASNRAISATNMNEGSSRSHSIFMMTIHQNNLHELSAKTGKLYLVDLAGSEKVGKTGAAGQTLEEAKNINKSLSALGNVINALTDSKSHQHIPYRDSKLTRILQESLGGNSRTTLIITCSPSPFNDQETLSTLRFGYRAKSIKNTPKINREFTVAELKLLLDKTETTLELREKRIKVLENLLLSQGIPLPKDNQIVDVPQPSVQKVTAPSTSAEETEVASETDSEEKDEEKFSSRDLSNLSLITRNDDQARIKLLESDLDMERNNVRTQTEKVNILRKEYANLSTKLSTTEKENEAMITKLAALTIALQELEDKFKEREVQFDKLNYSNEKLITENEELRRLTQDMSIRLKDIEQGEDNKKLSGEEEFKREDDESPSKLEREVTRENKGFVVVKPDIMQIMMKEMAAKFNITDESALNAFASEFLEKFKGGENVLKEESANGVYSVEEINRKHQEELASEKERNMKLHNDYLKLKEEYEKLKDGKAVSKPEETRLITKTEKSSPERPRHERERAITDFRDLQLRTDKIVKPQEGPVEEKDKFKHVEETVKKQNIDPLNSMYQQIASQKAQLKPEPQNAEKKVHKKTERILNLEKQLHETKELVNQYKSKIESLKSLISVSNTATSVSQVIPEKTENSDQFKQRKEAIKQEVNDSVMKDPKNQDDLLRRRNWEMNSSTKIVKPIRGGQSNRYTYKGKKSIGGGGGGTVKPFLNVLKQGNLPQAIPESLEIKEDYEKGLKGQENKGGEFQIDN